MRSTGHEDVEPAVVVVIEKSDAATVGFKNVFLVIYAAVNYRMDQACLGRHVDEIRKALRGIAPAYGWKQQRWQLEHVAAIHF